MEFLEVPTELAGKWEHALIMTYGADVQFFERTILNQFASSCRNKIILADGQRFLTSSQNYSDNSLVRYLNQHYIVEGVFNKNAAHAKLILLTNAEKGRLLVGSGNLGMQGYGTGGELFTRYEYSNDSPDELSAFIAIHHFLKQLMESGFIQGRTTRKRIDHMLENTNWLYHTPPNEQQPIWHNLDESFLSQLEKEINGQSVEELWIMSPFYDEKALAARKLLSTFNPAQTHILIQKGCTSVNPDELMAIVDEQNGKCTIEDICLDGDNPYIHAKLYVFKLKDRAICLQGSPNLSQVAMLFNGTRGNIELANLLVGERDSFDYIIEMIEERTLTDDLSEFDLSFRKDEDDEEQSLEQGILLESGEWERDTLSLYIKGEISDWQSLSLIIDSSPFPINMKQQFPPRIDLLLNDDAIKQLNNWPPAPVKLQWANDETNAIFVCNIAALDRVLESSDSTEKLERIGGLDLEDHELEQLLDELNSALLIDQKSIWELAGKKTQAPAEADDDQWIDYADVDYDALRQHPKIQQYFQAKLGSGSHARTRLQIILSSITGHFNGLVDIQNRTSTVDLSAMLKADVEIEDMDEREDEEEEIQQQRSTSTKHIRQVLKKFITRYLNGIQSKKFQEIAGFEVLAKNYSIFSTFLWYVFSKDWLDDDYILQNLLQIWAFYWGDGETTGYFDNLSEEDHNTLQVVVEQHHADAYLIAAIFYCSQLSRIEHWEDERFQIRDLWRTLLARAPFKFDISLFENAWIVVSELIPYDTPIPSKIAQELATLTYFDTRDSFVRKLQDDPQFQLGNCQFVKEKVFNQSQSIDCLRIGNIRGLSSFDDAMNLLGEWMAFETLGYYRIATDESPPNRLIFFDFEQDLGLYKHEDLDDVIEFHTLPSMNRWNNRLLEIRAFALEADKGLIFPYR